MTGRSTEDGGEGRSTGPERKMIAVATPAPNTAANLTAEPTKDMAIPDRPESKT